MLAAAVMAIAVLAVWQMLTSSPQGERAQSEGDGSQDAATTAQHDPDPERQEPSGPLDDDGETVDLATADPDPDDDNPGAPVESDADATEAERAAGAPFTLAEPDA
jgi:hypothetical protein